MIRILFLGAAAIGLAACQPASTSAGEVQLTAAQTKVPADYDWSFVPHGGSGDLDFGDGDWAEGVSLFHLSCLPNSRQVEMSWGDEGEVVLTAGTATETFEANARAETDHPVLVALRDSGSLAIGRGDEDLTLTGKTRGKAQLAQFFAYCDTGADPRFPPEDAAA